MNVQDIVQAVAELEDDNAIALVNEAIEKGLNPREVLEEGVLAGLKEIGQRFAAKEYFLAELTMGAKLVDDCIAILEPHLPKSEGPKRGVVVLGAVQGDLHSIGYSLVGKQLELAGYEVHYLGINVPSMTFIDKAKEINANIIGLSAFLVTTVPYCKELVDYLRDMGVRDKYKVIIGGTGCNHEVAESMGTDGFAENANDAVILCDRLLGHQA